MANARSPSTGYKTASFPDTDDSRTSPFSGSALFDHLLQRNIAKTLHERYFLIIKLLVQSITISKDQRGYDDLDEDYFSHRGNSSPDATASSWSVSASVGTAVVDTASLSLDDIVSAGFAGGGGSFS